MAEDEIERSTCPDCGQPIEECGDPNKLWYPQRRICYASRELAAAVERYDDLHPEDRRYHDGTEVFWSKAPSEATPYHYKAGVTIIVTPYDVNPDDKFLSEQPRPTTSASPEGED